ncbi:MAG: DNA-processing protein DprA [Kiritimatiellae bacterium]|nr:DNA-processing protein DprA [Kiritimatiellia bacterium]MDW8458551.1 DNA-processing protein DprA [Verrucomicrobiota bacterium]
MTRREAFIALNMIDDLGPVRVRRLLEALKSPEAVWQADEETLCEVEGIGPELARRILTQRNEVDPLEEESRARRIGARIITQEEPEYPEQLKTIYDPPLVLYVRGSLEKRDRQALAIVGTRSPTHYGVSMADRLAYQAAKAGFTIVSGLARGIDTVAHKSALKAGGRTLAVLGSALDRLYPSENAELADRIAENGAVISEYTLGREPDRSTFPYRNRIVSGLSMGLVVVEADLKSGALITANDAVEQGRSVFAVPGRADTPHARGCHKLIKQGAVLCEGIDDILDEFDLLLPEARARVDRTMPTRPPVNLSPDEQAVVRALWQGPLDVDSLARASGVPIAGLNGLLLGLEMKKVVRVLPGRLVDLWEGLRAEAPVVRGD